ncbi:MAG: precorrin-6y C5,15-methyltransferase (decarboxylating) subunit CbiE [Thermoleophilia bacterium]|nr:precorrin-6y C5,15-methyltransferase (decarboxylating) subunit CbiE [Thermoleophilia bacterium]
MSGPLAEVLEEVAARLAGGRDVCVLTSGDPGYFSLLAALERRFPGRCVVEPGVSSVQLLAARVGLPWQEAVHFSAHGRDLDFVPPADRPCAVLCDGTHTPAAVAAWLAQAGLEGTMAVGVDLGGPEEQVVVGSPSQVAAGRFGRPAAVLFAPQIWVDAGGWTIAPRAVPVRPVLGARAPGMPDDVFLRLEGVPLSRWEVRAVLVAVCRPAERRVIWDVGAGSGGFAVELAAQAPLARVLAFERDPNGCRMTAENAGRFGVRVELIQGVAPEAFSEVEAQAGPDLAVVGGSGGRLAAVLDGLGERLQVGGRVVVAAVTLETLGTAQRLLCDPPWADFDALQLSSARLDRAGIMRGMNPVTLLWADKGA